MTMQLKYFYYLVTEEGVIPSTDVTTNINMSDGSLIDSRLFIKYNLLR